MKYSPTTKGFYSESIHGTVTMEIQDPTWIRPMIQVPQDDGNGGTILVDVLDMDAIPAHITVPNPECTIPADAVDVTPAQYSTLMAAQAAGQIIQPDANGNPVAVDVPPPSLQVAQETACAAIDAQAGQTRMKYITDVAGQSETYLLKYSDASSYKAAGYPVATASYPMVEAEAKALYGSAPTPGEYHAATDFIIATQAQWMALAATIEQQRRTGKIAVGVATTLVDVQAAQQAAIAALAAL